MTQVLAPCAGRVLALADVPDPVFAGEMVGPGVAVEPDEGRQTVVSPVAGKLVKLHPHAFVVLTDDGVGVLVHLGIDTVRLEGRGFELVAEEGATIAAGDPVVRWDPGVGRGGDVDGRPGRRDGPARRLGGRYRTPARPWRPATRCSTA